MNTPADKIKEEFAKRINQAMEAKNYPVRGRARILSKEFGISDKGAGKWLKGEAIPETAKIPLLADFLGVSAEWLLNGSEQPLISKNDIHFAPIRFRESDAPINPNHVRIPIYKNIKAACGAGIENFLEDVSDYLNVDPLFLKMMGVESNPKNLRIIYAAEYSMYPTVAPNSPLFVDISDKDPSALKNGNVYVFMHNYELRMKRVFVSYGSNTVKLTSDNPDKNRYPDEFITNEQLNEINFVGRLELALVKP
ncbi:S24 family peptidase [Acinetobacter sichuanensis]|uniref:S24 family peptidase n=2 Tax=Acinetobacter sichuanensis TaxID=2136183 RepID=A0ABV7BM11_9GAMM|nr:LexA family transcriptional regulator [Acinetobacter sichuanensis]